MSTLHPDGYNISKSVGHLHSMTHFKFTLHSGLVAMHNRTFDLSRLEYINSMVTTSLAVPLMFLITQITIYALYCWLIHRRSAKRLANQKRRQLTIQHPHHLPVHTARKRGYFFSNCLFYYQMLAIGCLAILAMSYSIYRLYDGLDQSVETLDKLIESSNQSKERFNGVNETLSKWNNILSTSANLTTAVANGTWLSRTANMTHQNLNYFYRQFHPDERDNLAAFRQLFEFVVCLLTMCNAINVTLFLLFIVFYYLYSCAKVIETKSLVLLNLLAVTIMTIMFGVNFGTGMAAADYCSEAKAVTYDMVQHKIYGNNPYTRPVVQYYLYCGVKEWAPVEEQKNKVVDLLDAFSNITTVFDIRLNKLINLDHVKDQVETTYKSMACSPFIDQGLGQFCTEPIDAITLLTITNLLAAFLLMFLLFVVTFKL